jgi:hypothetical protein
MKLLTTIPARNDGTVIARIPGVEKPYIFKGDPLACEVADKAHITTLINTKRFFPADAEDFSAVAKDLKPPKQEEDPGYDVKEVEVGDEDPAAPASFDVATADEKALRDFIRAKTGKTPGPNTSTEKLRAIAETVAD